MTQYEELAPRFKEALLTRAKIKIPFWSLLGMEVVDVKMGWAQTKIPFSRKLANANGLAHGGAIFSAADTAVGIALAGLVDKEDFITTLEMKINYVKPVGSGEIIAEAKIIHKGKNTAIGDAEVRDSDGSLVAKAVCTYAIIKKSDTK
ncbi:MAG: PaaI family thioesterase [Desulfobacterales bacterium]